jgi:hypothetical protein
MQLQKPLTDASKYAITVLDFITRHQIPFNPYVPLLFKQEIHLSAEDYPEKPPDRSQLYRHLNPPAENAWLGGVPVGKVLTEESKKRYKLIAKQYKHRLSSDIYNPPLHLTYNWDDFGSESEAMEKLLKDQKDFNDKHKTWRNQYRIRYCELTDLFFLQVRVNHMFPYACFECDIEDCKRIFENSWYLNQVEYLDNFSEKMLRNHIVMRDPNNVKAKGMSIFRLLFENGSRIPFDNNVLNCRKNNLVPMGDKRKF